MIRRSLHPVAWWIWGVLLAAAAIRITNPWLTGLLIGAIWLVVAARRRDVPWARSYGRFLRIGLVVIVIRLGLQVAFAPPVPGTELFTLPEVGLPDWAAGVRIGGRVTAEGLLQAFYEGLRLVGLLAAVGAANALADPYRMLRALPATLYEAGVAVAVALSLVPQAATSAAQVRDARRLRGRPTKGLAGLRGIALPVLEGALDRSVSMAASMDARGFGRRALVDDHRRRRLHALSLAGLLAIGIGTYGLLDSGAPFGLGLPVLAAGSIMLAATLAAGGGETRRTRYRPDPWTAAEWATVASGAGVLAGLIVAGRAGIDLTASVQPLAAPGVPLVAAVIVLFAALPAFATPEPAP